MGETRLLVTTDEGLYCPPGDFHVGPWRPVDRAVITHAHADHATWGCRRYLTSNPGEHVPRARDDRHPLRGERDSAPAGEGPP